MSFQARTALSETVAMDLAIEATVEQLRIANVLDETLIVVTADHGHTMSMSGYPYRGTNIVGQNL